jgi:hypothetical protein
MSLPSFLCIGTQKAGTSWLFEQLRQNPDIWMPPIKELHYFDHLYCQENRVWTKWHLQQSVKLAIKNHLNQSKIDLHYIKYLTSIATSKIFTEQWYEKIFKRPAANKKITGDITPNYCTIGSEGISYVRSFLNQPKLIWLIRDPLQRALSQLRMNLSRQGNSNVADEAILWNAAREPSILNRGNLSKYIPEWESKFPHDKILYMPYKEISSNPLDFLNNVESFLEISHFDGYLSPEKIVHSTKKINIPESILDFLIDILQSENQFLTMRFGKDFCARI